MRRVILASLFAFLPWASAHAYDGFPAQLTEADRARLDRFDAVRAEAIRDAERGAAADRAVLAKVLEGDAGPIGIETLPGRWRCRTAKVGAQGDLLPLVVYPDFECRITALPGGGLKFEKITGSQRTSGMLYPYDRDRLGYAGSSWYGYEKGPKPYGTDPDRDEVGVLVRVSSTRLRLELPSPKLESLFDIIELRRR
jgi:hypothetical protein